MHAHEKCLLMCVCVYNSLQDLMKHSQAVLIQLQDFRKKRFAEHNSVCALQKQNCAQDAKKKKKISEVYL